MTDFDNEQIDDQAAAYERGDWQPPDDDNDDGPDPFPASFDEWNARRMNSGMNPGTFWDYLEAMPAPQRTALDRAALIQFKAIDPDEEI